ncbi:MAG: hypothetical protein OCC45_04335 [Desulfotalea sp.]
MQNQTILQWFTICLAAFLFSGCSATQNKNDLEAFNNNLKLNQTQEALDIAFSSGGFNDEDETDDMLWALQAANVLSLQEEFERSSFVYKQAESLMKEDDTKNMGTKSLQTVGAVLYNNSINDYSQTVFDTVMINTYKGLNNLFIGESQKARVEFNRAEDRQRRAKEHFSKKIAEQEKKIKKEKKSTGGSKSAWNMTAAKSDINKQFAEVEQWKPYGDYINPYTDYLRGLYFMLNAAPGNLGSDYGKAVFSLKRAAGSQGNNRVIANDLSMAKKLKNGSWKINNLRPQVWVIFENGLAPSIDEIIIPIPLFLVTNEVSYAQIALPKLVIQEKAYNYLTVSSGKKKLGKTMQIASIDRVVQSEYKKEFPYMVTEAITSAIIKGILQYVAQDQLGIFGAIGGALYQTATTHVDTRSWTALPKEVQALRIRKPKNNNITISAPGMIVPINIELPEGRYNIVHVRAAGSPSQPIVRIASFK